MGLHLDWGFRESSLTRDEKTAEMKIIMCKAQSNQVEEHLKIFYYFHLVQLYKSASEAPEPIPCRPEALYSWLPSAKTSLNPFPWRLENPGSVFRLKHDFLPCSLSFPHLPLFPAPQYSSHPQASHFILLLINATFDRNFQLVVISHNLSSCFKSKRKFDLVSQFQIEGL